MSLLFDPNGHRKYLTLRERQAFLEAALAASPETDTFCTVLAYTGARISEILALTPERIDTEAGVIILESLKKRRRGVYRAVPVPQQILLRLDAVHGLKEHASSECLWPWCRTTGWKRVKQTMSEAHVEGPQASPKGLRHAFGVIALQSGVPLNLLKRWLGHAHLSTTAIYADAVGEEERSIAAGFWKTF